MRLSQKQRTKNYLRRIIAAVKSNGCQDCGEQNELTFDHLPEYQKYRNVSDIVTTDRSRRKLLLEMAKCDVVCWSCHVKREKKRHWRP